MGAISAYYGFIHCYVESISAVEKTRSVIIKTATIFGDGIRLRNNNYYLNNVYCDQYNTTQDSYDMALKGSEIVHDVNVRIPYKNLQLSYPFTFSSQSDIRRSVQTVIGEDEWGRPIHETKSYNCEYIYIMLIYPSDDYDKYEKSAYLQHNIVSGDIPIFNEPVPVHSNVENGLGIFAGYSQAVSKLKIT